MNQEEVFGQSAHVTDFVSNLAPMYLEEEIFRKKKRHSIKANLFWKNDPSHHDRFVRVLVVAVFICKDLGS